MHILLYIFSFCLLLPAQQVDASSTSIQKEGKIVPRVAIDQQRLAAIAGMLARYEIEAKKLLEIVAVDHPVSSRVQKQAGLLLQLGRGIVGGARLRLPQCDAYLAASLLLEDRLPDIQLAVLEAEYHHDGSLPRATAACYHIKDLFVHPATVTVLVHNDTTLNNTTRTAISAEITEVLAHTEIVRQLIVY